MVALGFAPLLTVFFINLWGRPHYQFFPLALAGAGFLAWSRLKELARPFSPGQPRWTVLLVAKDVGTQAVTLTGVTVTGTGNGNYTATQQAGLTQSVTAKALTVQNITAASTVYDGTTTAKLGGTAALLVRTRSWWADGREKTAKPWGRLVSIQAESLGALVA